MYWLYDEDEVQEILKDRTSTPAHDEVNSVQALQDEEESR